MARIISCQLLRTHGFGIHVEDGNKSVSPTGLARNLSGLILMELALSIVTMPISSASLANFSLRRHLAKKVSTGGEESAGRRARGESYFLQKCMAVHEA